MNKETSKKYDIDTFEKLVNIVNDENIERLSIDFCMWLHYANNFIKESRKKNHKLYKGKQNWDVYKQTFIWIDDGEHHLNEIVVKDENTGEEKHIEVTRKQ